MRSRTRSEFEEMIVLLAVSFWLVVLRSASGLVGRFPEMLALDILATQGLANTEVQGSRRYDM